MLSTHAEQSDQTQRTSVNQYASSSASLFLAAAKTHESVPTKHAKQSDQTQCMSVKQQAYILASLFPTETTKAGAEKLFPWALDAVNLVYPLWVLLLCLLICPGTLSITDIPGYQSHIDCSFSRPRHLSLSTCYLRAVPTASCCSAP